MTQESSQLRTAPPGAGPATGPMATKGGRHNSGSAPIAIAPPMPTKLRRRPAYLAAGVLSVALGALLAAWLFTTSGSARSVIAVRQAVSRGEVITAADLTTVSITVDPALKVVPAQALNSVVGRRATVDLAAGGLVTANSYADSPLPAPGNSLVGLSFAAGQLPGEPLRSGDRVRIVQTPRDDVVTTNNTTNAATEAKVTPAEVVSTQTTDDGHVLVTVNVSSNQAPSLASMAANGRIALVLDSATK